jgi:hypothetical protein
VTIAQRPFVWGGTTYRIIRNFNAVKLNSEKQKLFNNRQLGYVHNGALAFFWT